MAKIFEFYHNQDYDGRTSPQDGAIFVGRYEGDEATAVERLKALRKAFGYSENSSKMFFQDKENTQIRQRAILDFSLSVNLDMVPGLCHEAKDFEDIVRQAIQDKIGNYHPELTLLRKKTRDPVDHGDGYRVPRSAVEMAKDAEIFPNCTMREYFESDRIIACTYNERDKECRWYLEGASIIKRITRDKACELLGGTFAPVLFDL